MDSCSKKWQVRKHWNDFLNASSVRGLKRTKTSETRLLRIFWVGFLLGSLALMIVQIQSVIQTYVSQKDSTAIQSRKLNFPVKFPAVSLCRESSYNSYDKVTRAMLRHNASVTTPASYSRKIADLLYRQFGNASGMSQSDLLYALGVISTFDTAVAYQAQVPRQATEEVAMPVINLLIFARVNFDNGSSVDLAYNMGIVGIETAGLPPGASLTPMKQASLKIEPFYHWEFFLCNTLQLDVPESDQGDIKSLDLLLWKPSPQFSTNQNATEDRAFPMRGFWTGDGIRMALHPSGQHGKVHIDNNGIIIQNGGYTEVRYSPLVTKFLDCSKGELLHGDQGQYDYNQNDCKYLSYDMELRRICNCTLDPFAWDYPQCMKINWTSLNSSDWGKCMGYVEWAVDSCIQPACVETHFLYVNSFAPWSINDFQWKWITDLLVSPATSLPKYLALSQMSDAASSAEINRPMLNFDAVKGSLTSITISRQSSSAVYQQEVQLTSLANLFSSCGGAMSLFMGITLTLLAEFLEFVYHVCRRRGATATTPLPAVGKGDTTAAADNGEAQTTA